MLEKKLEVEMFDGSKKEFVLKAISRETRKKLNEIIAPAEVSSDQTATVRIPFGKWEEYRELYIVASITSPEKYKNVSELGALPNTSFESLFFACLEVNGEKNPLQTEKK